MRCGYRGDHLVSRSKCGSLVYWGYQPRGGYRLGPRRGGQRMEFNRVAIATASFRVDAVSFEWLEHTL